ncbi:MAG TPA: hypothetical protein VN873_07030 [Candidatus Angelobacter sp.]|nr:hypothetical protein [Candidatus Angelobacter sp.]
MINLRIKMNGKQSAVELPNPPVGRPATARLPDPSVHSWSSENLATAKPSRASAASARKPKRQLYADYRALLSLESKAKKLNFLSLQDARPEPAPSPVSGNRERVLPLFEDNERNGFTDVLSNDSLPLPSPVDQPGFLMIDQRMSMFFGSRRNLKSVVAANVAALLAWRMFAQGRKTGGIVFNDKNIVQIRPGHSRLHTLLLLQTVLGRNHDLQPNSGICSNPTMLNQALRRAAKLSGDSLIFLITDASGHDAETFRLTTNLSQTGNLLVILIYDPLQTRLSEIFRRQQINASRFLAEGVPVAPVNTYTDVTYQLRHSSIKSALSSFAKLRRARLAPLEESIP